MLFRPAFFAKPLNKAQKAPAREGGEREGSGREYTLSTRAEAGGGRRINSGLPGSPSSATARQPCGKRGAARPRTPPRSPGRCPREKRRAGSAGGTSGQGPLPLPGPRGGGQRRCGEPVARETRGPGGALGTEGQHRPGSDMRDDARGWLEEDSG